MQFPVQLLFHHLRNDDTTRLFFFLIENLILKCVFVCVLFFSFFSHRSFGIC